MRALNNPTPSLHLGLPGFCFEDLYAPSGLRRLAERFDAQLQGDAPGLFQAFDAWRKSGGTTPTGPAESELLIQVARHVSRFVATLFRIEPESERLARHLRGELPLFDFKREFITRRVFKKGAQDRPALAEFPSLDGRMRLLMQLGFPDALAHGDLERGLAESILTLLELERLFSGNLAPAHQDRAPALRERWATLRAALTATPEGLDAFGSSLVTKGDDAAELQSVRALLSLADRWTYARALHPETRALFHSWPTLRLPKPLVFDQLVQLRRPDAGMEELAEGLEHHLRHRDGFKLTDRRGTPRDVMNEVDYCVLCHERQKDSCSKGFPAKDPVAEGHSFKKNPLGIPLTGCPLDERISEAHALKREGDSVAALAMVTLDNPMCAGTGHRICNDCMKACIFQKQEPVNIPLAETATLTDVLDLPWGFEIYGLLTRWNPLNPRRPYALPYVGRNVLVVGLGPAGYTLAHYLLNEGFAVTGVDGLKIEPFPDELVGRNGHALQPIRDWRELTRELDERVLEGFGGVSEYGITVRWDKNFLTLIHLTLARREGLRIHGGIRFGGTLTVEDAWALGFDHVAIAAGAGRPTLIGMKNNLIRGIRKASDFLMALQLTGAFKRDALANLQVRLPAIVIGGGLTGIDTATELMAYYPVQVEKTLERHEKLVADLGEDSVLARLDAEERATYETFLTHGRAVRAERQKAHAEGRAPDFIHLVRAWGGVSLVYRRGLTESPAYRLNHEEVSKALEEGIRFIERMSPTEALPDDTGAVRAIRFERMVTVDGRLKGSGQFFELPARTVCVAAGTSPNVTYEKEYPGTFQLDAAKEYFQGHELVDDGSGFTLQPVEAQEDPNAKVGFFTSYQRDGRFVSFYGDNHPAYAGNVVKAMASAKDGHPQVARLFAKEVAGLDFRDTAAQEARDTQRAAHFAKLDEAFLARVVRVNRLTPTIVEVVVKAPFAASHFSPGQFYRLQNFERNAPLVDGVRLTMEGLALTGAWVDKEQGLMGTIVLEMGSSSRLCAALKPGEPVVLMGPTGAPTEIAPNETVVLVGGGLGNAVLFSIARSLKAAGCRVVYFAGYRLKADAFKQDEIEAGTDQVIWSVDAGDLLDVRRPQDAAFRGNVVQALVAYAEGRLGVEPVISLSEVDRVIAIGSDRMMRAVAEARHGVLQPFLKPGHEAIGSINSPMQCMMKEICAQCLQRHVDPATGKETWVFSCYNQDQRLDHVDFVNLGQRLRGNTVLEKQGDAFLAQLLKKAPGLKRV
ncbi:pyridine nucleotide-disulfide oxidoreductase [Corallococcus sp. AB049A]|uniref:FAD-dependent oxidoreductase n=1 Tax=Corallococcus sp. AB049A TaxID=2316721 RepID=UPI000EA3CE9D|nr:FAD-dependent oxidoreductase [Corallococcus sp. AB049A]RKH42197.1 pyridine nucleotide-disulfide oxidoreductase [Corallococcus sp. AB050B]RKI55177.1 pyridine nucleotide-disulfide oxidoreductase [Corallococcus sp. AB049A]